MAETEVKSTKEVRQKIKDRIESYERQQRVRFSMHDNKGAHKLGLRLKELYFARDLINSFEAGLKDKITKLQKLRENEHDVRKLWKSKNCEETLSRLLEGEGGDVNG